MFVFAAAIHARIGLRTIAAEWLGWRGGRAEFAMVLVALVARGRGLRAVWRGGGRMRAARATIRRTGRSSCIALSGVALALFLPVHFWALGTALQGEARARTEFLRWTRAAAGHRGASGASWCCSAAHLAGGLRLLALEFLPWRDWQKTLAALGAAFAIVAGLAFALAR